MKKILPIVLILFSLNLSSQEITYKEAYKSIGLYSTSIILHAAGDALKDSDRKELGHLSNALGTGILVASPFILDVTKDDWYWYAISYIGLRYALYDATYNLTRRLPFDYNGNTSYYDKAMRKQPKGLQTLTKLLALGVSVSIPFNEFSHKKKHYRNKYY